MAAVAHQPGEAPFHEETIVAYAKAARALAAWMTAEKIDGDFTACAATLTGCGHTLASRVAARTSSATCPPVHLARDRLRPTAPYTADPATPPAGRRRTAARASVPPGAPGLAGTGPRIPASSEPSPGR